MSERDDPRERVRKRLAQMADAAAFAAAASLGACAGSPDNGYGVVDPLPTPYVCPTSPEGGFVIVPRWVSDNTDRIFANVFPPSTLNVVVPAITASGGVTVSRDNLGQGVYLEAARGQWPETVELTFGYPCRTPSGSPSMVTYVFRLTIGPVHEGNVLWEQVTDAADEDAGL